MTLPTQRTIYEVIQAWMWNEFHNTITHRRSPCLILFFLVMGSSCYHLCSRQYKNNASILLENSFMSEMQRVMTMVYEHYPN